MSNLNENYVMYSQEAAGYLFVSHGPPEHQLADAEERRWFVADKEYTSVKVLRAKTARAGKAKSDAPSAVVSRGILAAWHQVTAFVFAGNSRFTLVSLKTGMRYTYRVKAKKADLKSANPAVQADPAYFVEVLYGPDNTKSFKYIGALRKPGRFWITDKSKLPCTSPSVVTFIWFLGEMRGARPVLGKYLEVWHEGRCGVCGRVLTVPESITRGLGPECWERGGAAL